MERGHRKQELGAQDLWAQLLPRALGAPVPATATQLLWLRGLPGAGATGAERGMHFAARLSGALDLDLLRECLQALRQRHEALRSRIVNSAGTVVLQVDSAGPVAFDMVSLEDGAASLPQGEIARRCEEFVTTKVDLANGSLFAARLFRLSARQHVLIVAAEHSVTDEISNAILNDELWTLYRQGELRQSFSLPGLRLQFGDYAVWLHQTSAAWRRRHESYWSSRLAGAPAVRWPHLPPSLQQCGEEARYPMLHIPLGRELSDGLRQVAARERKLLPFVVLAVHVAALSRWLQQRDLVVRFVAHGRYRPELQRMVGFMACCLHLRIEVSPSDTLVDLLQRSIEEMQSAYQRHDFDSVAAELPSGVGELTFNWAARCASPTSLPASGASEQALHVETLSSPIAWPRGRPYFTAFADTPGGVVASVHCQPGHFARSSIDEYGEDLRLFAAKFCERPLEPVGKMG